MATRPLPRPTDAECFASQAGGASVERRFRGLGKGFFEVQQAIQAARAARVQALEAERRQARVQYVLDFSFLRAQMEKGGLAVTAIRCPVCGGTLELPSSGTTAKCPYCGAAVVAQDVFNRMKGLIGSCPS